LTWVSCRRAIYSKLIYALPHGIEADTNLLRWRSLYLLVQKAHYKTGNVRKLEAAIKVYGGLLQVYPEAFEKLTSMLLHPFPKIRNQVADMLFIARGVGKGVNWTKAGKEDLKRLKEELGRENNKA
jgi:tubulin-specific chaperone D